MYFTFAYVGVGNLKVLSEGCFCSQWKEFTISASWPWCPHERPTVSVELPLSCIQYIKWCWNICRDVKVIALVFIMWLSYMQLCCSYMNGSVTQEVMAMLWQNGLTESIFFHLKQHRKWPTCSSAETSTTSSSHRAWNEGLLWRSWMGIEEVLVSASEISIHYHSEYQRRDLHWFSDSVAYE